MSSLNTSIKLLEISLGIHLSKEQLAIVKYDLLTPVLVNACAGSGKTMLFLFMALTLIVNGQTQPCNVLGVTFSKRAQLDMGRRYNDDLNKMHYWGADKYIPNSAPSFTTFHALFYRLLKHLPRYRYFRVLASYHSIEYQLSKAIPYPSKLLSKFALLDKIFEIRSQLINRGFTYDGISKVPNSRKILPSQVKLLLNVRKYTDNSEKRLQANYQTVISAYNKYKLNHHYLDFTDMMTKLLVIMLHNNKAKKYIQNIMAQFHYVFLDEFQDINNLQWELMNLILSKKALHHMMLIGDDDQSIYSFRGSNPNIILTFHKKYPISKTFNLSTNYRTGGNILNTTKSLIKANQYRLSKHLFTGRHNEGIFKEIFCNDSRYSANEVVLKILLQKIHNPHINNGDLAVLVHYNNSRMFVIDWLASHHHYIRVNNPRYILQYNKIYRILMIVAFGLNNNQFMPIYKESTRIGFRPYKKHMKLIQSNNYPFKTLSQYCKVALKKKGQCSDKHLKIDNNISKYLIKLQKDKSKKNYGKELLTLTKQLTSKYFKYMEKHNFINTKLVQSIKLYLFSDFCKISNPDSMNNFIKTERNKCNILLHHDFPQNQAPIHILSLHQSKGLQFKQVFLYDINSRRDSFGEIMLEKTFAPNLSVLSFLTKLLLMKEKQIDKLDIFLFGKTAGKTYTDLLNHIKVYMKSNHIKSVKVLYETLFKKHISSDDVDSLQIKHRILFRYRSTIHSSKFIEEQRRLIYVGITRAQQRIYLAYNRDADPLLNELSIPNKDKYYFESNGKLLNYNQNTKYLKKLK